MIRLVDDTFLHRAADAAGYRLAPQRLTQAAIEQPVHVANWIVAAARYTATSTIHHLLTDAARQLRDRLTGTPPARLGGTLEALAAVCDLLAGIDADLDEALRDIGRHSVALAHLDRPPLIDDPAAIALPAALAGRQEARAGSGAGQAARAHHIPAATRCPQAAAGPAARTGNARRPTAGLTPNRSPTATRPRFSRDTRVALRMQGAQRQ